MHKLCFMIKPLKRKIVISGTNLSCKNMLVCTNLWPRFSNQTKSWKCFFTKMDGRLIRAVYKFSVDNSDVLKRYLLPKSHILYVHQTYRTIIVRYWSRSAEDSSFSCQNLFLCFRNNKQVVIWFIIYVISFWDIIL